MDSDPTLSNVDQPGHLSADRFEVGQTVDGKYEIISLLGRGGMGTVYRVHHLLLNTDLALKTLDTKHLSDTSTSRRFKTEAKAAFSLKHPNLVKVHDFGALEDGQPFLVMDLVQGKTLQAMITERGRLPLEEVKAIFAQLCFGLAHAHQQQVVHRDIKPANIMIVDGADLKSEGSVKILDFGIAKIVNSDRGEMQTLTQTGEIFGSPYYMSPEQCSGASVDQRCDIYSLGCVLFEALTGTPPLVGSNALRTMMLHVNEAPPSLKEATLGIDFPEELEQMVAKMLAKQPGDRYSDIGAVAQELFRICGATQSDQNETSTSLKGSAQSIAAARSGKAGIITLSYLQLSGLVLATAIVSILGTLCASRFPNSSAPQTAIEQKKEHEKAAEKVQIKEAINEFSNDLFSSGTKNHLNAKQAFDNCSDIKATPINSQEIEINFPAYAIGNIQFAAPGGRHKSREAKDRVVIPANCSRELVVNADHDTYALTNASIYERVDPNLFHIVSFTGPNLDGLYASYNQTFKKNVDDGFEHFFSAAGKWKSVAILKIFRFDLTQSMLDSIDGMKLRSLELYNTGALPGSWKNKRFFQTVEGLIEHNVAMTEILEELTHSPSIRALILESSLSVQEIHLISKCKKLDTLVILSTDLPDSVAAEISKLTNVKDLRLRPSAVKSKAITTYFRNWEKNSPVGAEKDHICLRRRI